MAKKYKMKTHSGAKARFYVTGSGKVLRRKIGINNFRRKKRGETLRASHGTLPGSKPDAPRRTKPLAAV